MSQKMQPTDVSQFISELAAGVLEDQLAYAISLVANSVIEQNRAGEINLKLKMTRVGSTDQVKVSHVLKYTKPKAFGDSVETEGLDTVMFVNLNGHVTQFADHQVDAFQLDKTT